MNRVPSDDCREGLRPPQFRLRSMLLWVTALSVTFALMSVAGPYGVFALSLLLLSIAAHVAGNAMGTALRECGSRPAVARPAAERFRSPRPGEFAPRTQLGLHQAASRLVLSATLLGLVAGALGGDWLVSWLYGPGVPWLNRCIGVVAFTALGGIWSFATVGFLHAFVAAAWHATRQKDVR